MRLIHKDIPCTSRTDTITLYPIGDVHIGGNCAEGHLKRRIQEIAQDPKAYIVLGGDIIDAIKPQDTRRFDFEALPDWIVEGDATTTREKTDRHIASAN